MLSGGASGESCAVCGVWGAGGRSADGCRATIRTTPKPMNAIGMAFSARLFPRLRGATRQHSTTQQQHALVPQTVVADVILPRQENDFKS